MGSGKWNSKIACLTKNTKMWKRLKKEKKGRCLLIAEKQMSETGDRSNSKDDKIMRKNNFWRSDN